jgi:hypothetical protein
MIDRQFLEVRDECIRRYQRIDPRLLVSWVRTKGDLASNLIAPFNVHAVGIARKRKRGRLMPQLSVRVTVLRKLAPEDVPREGGTLIEDEIMGVPIDVVVAGPLVIEPHNGSGGVQEATTNVRPLQAGCQISHGDVNFGTLSAVCRSIIRGEEQDRLLLSCRHVLDGFLPDPTRLPIFQPGDPVTTRPLDRIAGEIRRVVKANDPLNPRAYSADAAVAKLDAGIPIDPGYLGIGASGGILDLLSGDVNETDLLSGDEFIKFGRTTGLTTGTLESARENLHFTIGDVVHGLNDQFVIRRMDGSITPMSDPGDSGAMVFRKSDRKAVGIVVGSPLGDLNDVQAVISPLRPILSELQIKLL